MGKEEIECVLCKTYSHPVLSVTAMQMQVMLPLPSVCLWRVAYASALASLYYVLYAGCQGGGQEVEGTEEGEVRKR